MIIIVDYGMGNLRSVSKCFERLGFRVHTSSNAEQIEKAGKLILPGVGHFAQAMNNLRKLKLIDALDRAVLVKKVPILGICLGMQLFSEWSAEGDTAGLGWISARVERFDASVTKFSERIPHMGWNNIIPIKKKSILDEITEHDTFYFAHSFFVICDNYEDVLAQSTYGIEFTSAINCSNIYGTQFHPEKSHKRGLRILQKFAQID